jgi:hypothetical protein
MCLACSKHIGARRLIVDEIGLPADVELVASGLGLGKALEREPAVP